MSSTVNKILWNAYQIKQFEQESGQALLRDESTLDLFSQDFGKLVQSRPAAVCMPKDTKALHQLIQFASNNRLPVTIRANGLSQCGQSLPINGGLTLSMNHFNQVLDTEGEAIWVEACASWADLVGRSLKDGLAPYVLPYNCNLSVAGVLSAGGVGASSFKYGFINAHVAALEVMDGSGAVHIVEKDSPLFHACLSGQGRCAVITKAKIKLRPVQPKVKTFSLVYNDVAAWFKDMAKMKSVADYMELICSPSIQGAKLHNGKRVPIAQWLYGMHLSVEFSGTNAPKLEDIAPDLNYWNVLNTQEEPIESYFLRHNSRFDMMKLLGQWDLFHPWYECFVPTKVLEENLQHMLHALPLHYASLAHVVPIAPHKADLLMFPEAESVSEFMILNPGIPEPLKDSSLQAVEDLDKFLLKEGGKRYLSGYLGVKVGEEYWRGHYGDKYDWWKGLKERYDPLGVFCSYLYF